MSTREQRLAELEAKWDADDAALCRLAEWRCLERTLEALYRAVRAGDTSVYTKTRITRLEAVQAALLGSPEALTR
ncbi:hypothetical protein [Streptomyces sp. NBC_00299]|uniref:hypothetical protein n=1 Tax=Streptomyces sp. NBC_00299 TaxID=2975705 RepID=UPI002E2A967B|nr:hypothetical protein [Streptomyces sp. NBC_00299]